MSSHDPADVANGIGSIAQNSMRCMLELGHEVCGVFIVDESARGPICSQSRSGFLDQLSVVRLARKNDFMKDSFRALSRVFLSPVERKFGQEVRLRSRDCDLAVWFGTLWDPLNMAILTDCECPVVLHVNDSITLVRQQRSVSISGRIQTAVAKYHESGVIRRLGTDRAAIVYVAEADRQCALTMARPQNETGVSCIPLAVNTDVFSPATEANLRSSDPVLLLTGHMGYTPNVLAATHLVRNILPLLPQKLELRFVGRDPRPTVLELAQADPRVRVTGGVEDIVSEYRNADVFVAPLPFSYGMKTKVLEAMSCGLPVVASPEGCSGFEGGTPPGILVGNSSEEIAALITKLLADERLRRSLGRAGRDHVLMNYGWMDRTRRLVSLLRSEEKLAPVRAGKP